MNALNTQETIIDDGATTLIRSSAQDWLPEQTHHGPSGKSGLDDDPQWYRDAVIYQTHIKAFFDQSDDGIGDFNGLIEKLDYIRDLGATAIWLLPFYPSPLRDDGYDIQDYRAINPAYGTMADVRRLIKEAHRRGIRLITELVINHTSDQHPWFERARRARPGSKYRDYYVWSDTADRYQDTRIIFLDTETSNWTWDPVAKAYFWHRFYSHQPDLNFDNPKVVEEIISVLHFWLKLGIDGLRLDAVPYLIEREGTNCENLPETHDVLRRIRAEVDKHFPGRMLLAEANQWPEDTRPYFGDGDQCHMAFHFPLMPRMYLSVAREDRHPVTDIMRQTPTIPDGCQWAIFLRNHDELTLEMVTDKERDYLWETYAADKRMRINMGIRRRLAPLMGNDRRKIELMNSMLMSMPGTPVIYYGDEIGMGDNVFLGDRDGVRTPMQWSPDRNGGFSRSDPQRLYLPSIMDAVYGYQAVNVESQRSNASSLLNWMQRLIAVRQSYRAFARGELRFLYPGNRRILAYLREFENETVLCVVNLSRHAQPVELNLGEFEGHVPVELLGKNPFPPIGKLPYLLTLPGHGFYWFLLEPEAGIPDWHQTLPEVLPDLPTLVSRVGWRGLLEGGNLLELETSVIPRFLSGQRWYAEKDKVLSSLHLECFGTIDSNNPDLQLFVCHLSFESGETSSYTLPLALVWDDAEGPADLSLAPFVMARVRAGARVGSLLDATALASFAHSVLAGMSAPAISANANEETGKQAASIIFESSSRLAQETLTDDALIQRVAAEQSNTSVIIDGRIMLKLYRRFEPGQHPEPEVSRYLTENCGFEHTPTWFGTMIAGTDSPGTIAAAFAYQNNQGDAWQYLRTTLERDIGMLALQDEAGDEPGAPVDIRSAQLLEPTLMFARTVGQRVRQMHEALSADADDGAFGSRKLAKSQVIRWRKEALARARLALGHTKRGLDSLAPELQDVGRSLLSARKKIEKALGSIDDVHPACVTRIHGDLHLGQILVTEGDCMILDFEGEPARPLAQRRVRGSNWQDVAGMMRSFDYLRQTVAQRLTIESPAHTDRIRALLDEWHREAGTAFLAGYLRDEAGQSTPETGADELATLRFFMLDKAFYEIVYEAANRPRWLGIPVNGANDLLQDAGSLAAVWESAHE